MSYQELIDHIKSAEDGNVKLTKREIRTIIIALRLLDSYDKALSEALELC